MERIFYSLVRGSKSSGHPPLSWHRVDWTQLLSAEDNYKQSLARFCPPSKDYTTDPPTPLPAQLVLDSRALEIQDTVVLSFLLLEKTRRLREMRKSRAAQSTNIRNQVRFESWDSGFGNYQ